MQVRSLSILDYKNKLSCDLRRILGWEYDTKTFNNSMEKSRRKNN